MTNREGTWRLKLLKSLRGLLFANIAVLFFGLAGVLGKLSVLPAPLIVFGRASFAGLVLLAACRFQRISFLLPGIGAVVSSLPTNTDVLKQG